MVAGEIASKPHTALRDGSGRLRHEECLTRDGFDGPFTIMYHVERPHTAAVTTAAHGWEIPEAVDDKPRPLARRHYRSQDLPRRGGPPVDARVPLLFNPDVVISIVHPDEADPVYFANGDGDDLYFVVEGGGVLRSALGDVTFAARDYVFVPKGLAHRFVPEDRPQVWLSIECAAGFGLPRQWRNEVGQLRMDAPYSHRDFRRPVFAGPRDEGLRDLVIKRGDTFHGFRYGHAPLDVVGWDGSVYPWAFPILNFQPRVGMVHLPPTVHGTFATRGALICSFVPRPLDFHPGRHPLPLSAFVGRVRRDHLLLRRPVHLPQGRRPGQHLAPSIRRHARPPPGRVRGKHRHPRHRRGGRHARHDAPAASHRRRPQRGRFRVPRELRVNAPARVGEGVSVSEFVLVFEGGWRVRARYAARVTQAAHANPTRTRTRGDRIPTLPRRSGGGPG
jgi:homogentisate 1,2-dioxygenase